MCSFDINNLFSELPWMNLSGTQMASHLHDKKENWPIPGSLGGAVTH